MNGLRAGCCQRSRRPPRSEPQNKNFLAKKSIMKTYRHALLCIVATFLTLSVQAQGTQTVYGKNRVQYHRDFDEWSQYESTNFITYWYGEARNIGQAVVMIAEQEFSSVQSILEHRINDKIQIIVYTDLSDLKQSNIGSEESFNNIGGQTKIVGNKVFVYFTGDHNELRRQVREGIASVYLDAMLFGSNLQEIVQNAVMLNLPPWFKDGLAAYAGEYWNTELDNQLRDALMNPKFQGFDRLAADHPRLVGQSLWYFISENFGKSAVSNLLYLTRINRSVESGFLYVLGSSYEAVTDSWALYFRQRYKMEDLERDKPDGKKLKFKNRRNLPISQVKLSPDGKKVAYATNEIGRFIVYVQDVRTGERQKLFKEGFRNPFQATDYNYPLLSWSPNNQEIAILYERRDQPKMLIYNTITKKFKSEDLSSQYQRVYSIDFVNPNTLAFSATVRGFSDIFLYYLNTRQTERITNDFYDDLDVVAVNIRNRKGILFASNRPDTLLTTLGSMDTIIPVGNFDIFYYDIETKSKELVRVTHTQMANERRPVAVDTLYFSYLSDRSGIFNREHAYLEDYIHHYNQIISFQDGSQIIINADSTLIDIDSTTIDTISIEPVIKQRAVIHTASNYSRNIIEQHTAPRVGKLAELLAIDGKHHIYLKDLQVDTVIVPLLTRFKQRQIAASQKTTNADRLPQRTPPPPVLQPVETPQIKLEELPVEKADTGKIDIDNYFFQSEFELKEKPAVVVEKPKAEKPEQADNISIVLPSELPRLVQEPAPKPTYRFRPGRITPYRLQFRTDYVTTQLDNSLLFEGLDNFTFNPEGFNYPPPGILMKGNFKDLFEDYEFEGGVRIPTTFNGSEYFMIFRDKKKRLDKQYAIYRRNTRYTQESRRSFIPDRSEVNILLGQMAVRYPLDIFRSLRATATIRRDRLTQLATSADTSQGNYFLGDPTRNEQRAGLKLEYVFDNTFDVALNIKNGARYKFFVEAVKVFSLDINRGVNLDFGRGAMGVVGMDARFYQRIGKYGVAATRLAGATSFGSERMLYYLGGVDNWLFPAQENDIPTPAVGSAIAFQTLATNMRGFGTNIRNGNNYVVLNNELRFPVFKMISERIKSPFLSNFQLVGFFDVGTAWSGRDPFSRDNPLNTKIISNGELITIKINYFRDPIVAGYGGGIRTVLFGYFVRADYAWGIETRNVQEPRLYISLGMDF